MKQSDGEKIAELAKEQERLRSLLEACNQLLEDFERKLLKMTDTLEHPS